MSYAVVPSLFGGLLLFGVPFYGGPIPGKGFLNHPYLQPGLPLVMILSPTKFVRKKRPPPSAACNQQALAACIWGIMLLLDLAYSSKNRKMKTNQIF